MKQIPLSRGLFALVDDDDYERILRFRWRANRQPRGTFRAIKHRSAECQFLYMHNVIMNARGVDHVDRDPLNNQKSNLRLCSKRENARNSDKVIRKKRPGDSRYKGVSFCRLNHRWKAQITIDGQNKYLGLFDSEEEAAHAYDISARKYFGIFAAPNFKA